MTGWATADFNAVMNVTSAIFLLAGWLIIRARRPAGAVPSAGEGRRIAAHRACMLAAAAASTCFFVSYIAYHLRVGSVRFAGQGWVRPVYFTILITHTILAVAIVPAVLRVLWLAWRERWTAHVALARWTAPVWLYVSVSGVVVYAMLYHG